MSVGDTRYLAIRNSNTDIALGVVTAKKKRTSDISSYDKAINS